MVNHYKPGGPKNPGWEPAHTRINFAGITRLEIIEVGKGREYVNTKIVSVEPSVQDAGRTLKLYVKNEDKENDT